MTLARYLQKLRKQKKFSRQRLAEMSTVPASTIKRFEGTGEISLRQLLLLWQSLDNLERIHQLAKQPAESIDQPKSIEEVLKHGF